MLGGGPLFVALVMEIGTTVVTVVTVVKSMLSSSWNNHLDIQ
jgi:hypothetical protein